MEIDFYIGLLIQTYRDFINVFSLGNGRASLVRFYTLLLKWNFHMCRRHSHRSGPELQSGAIGMKAGERIRSSNFCTVPCSNAIARIMVSCVIKWSWNHRSVQIWDCLKIIVFLYFIFFFSYIETIAIFENWIILVIPKGGKNHKSS